MSCSVDNVPAGGLVIALDTDMAVPKDIDRVLVECSQSGRVFFSAERQIGEGHDLMPLQLRVSSPGNNDPVLVRAIAFQGPEARIERSLITSMPSNWLASVRLPLNYLCASKVSATGESSCGADQTCKQGECAAAQLAAELLVRYEPNVRGTKLAASTAADGGMDAASSAMHASSASSDERCFDVAACFYQALDVEVEPVTCSFALPPELSPEQLNIALRLPLGQPGICENGSCFVVLDEDTEGYQVEAGRVYVPLSVCDRMLASMGAAITLGLDCPKKTLDNPICGSWSSVKTPVPTLDAASDGGNGIVVGTQPTRPSLLQGACSGVARQACGMCGTQARDCKDGTWSTWAACMTGGACVPGTSEMCPQGGKRTCGGDCTWGMCMTQTCTGPSSRACGNCGTQTRTCQNGTWGEWSACGGQGACMPNASQACAGGTQVCGGSCQWGACGNEACAGPASESCGSCGTRTRTCDPASGKYSAWGPCQAEGVCMPDATRACGLAGMQTCRGDCQWGEGCANQMCEGESVRLCGNCGTQSRTCNTENGSWSDWGECGDQGECAPNAARTCGKGGVQICGGNCRWDPACAGQRCMGTAARSCGNCGIQLRLCDTFSGEYPDWSTVACLAQGECNANTTRDCGNGGKQFCGADCRWQSGCGDQMCAGRGMRKNCGNCGSQSALCDAATGAWSTTQYGECTGQGCIPGATQPCGTNRVGTQICSDSCAWGTCLCDPKTKPMATCGLCGLGTQSVSCNDKTGLWEVGGCSKPGACTGTMTAACGNGGTKTCISGMCEWGMCIEKKVCPPDKKPPTTCGLCNDGAQTVMCNDMTGVWDTGSCSKPGECTGTMTAACGTGGTKGCNSNTCLWGTCVEKKVCPPEKKPTKCGLCGLGTQPVMCNETTGDWVVTGACSNPGECTGSMTASCGNGGTKTCNSSTCAYGACTGEKKDCPSETKPTKCGLCKLGTQPVMCNDTTGEWVVTGACSNPGECTGSMTASCGNGGTKTCNSSTCEYGACTGEKKMCSLSDKPLPACGNCGTQTPICDETNGTWKNGTCVMPSGACAPGTPKPCPGGESVTCSQGCQFPACPPVLDGGSGIN